MCNGCYGATASRLGQILGYYRELPVCRVSDSGGEPGPYADTIPHLAYMIFQGMFAAITPALITGAFAERMKFKTFLLFGLLWATFVYDPLALAGSGEGRLDRCPGRWISAAFFCGAYQLWRLGPCVPLSWADAVAFRQNIWLHMACRSR